MRLRHVGLVLALGLLTAADDPRPKSDDARAKQVEGTWLVTEASRDGKVSEQKAHDTMLIKDGQIKIKPDEQGGREELADYTLDTSKDPIEIDLKPRIPNADQDIEPPVLKGILKIDGDTLTLALSPPGQDRPTRFESAEGSETLVSTLKRQDAK